MEGGTEVLEGDEAVCCRICRLPAAENETLFSPCKCSGSIKFVHQSCLVSWLDHSNRQRCELCGHTFQFRPVYSANAPSSLPWTELAWVLASKGFASIVLCGRAVIVAHVWLLAVPLLTCWMWRLSFKNPFLEDFADFASRLNPSAILTDCVQGSLISAALVFGLLFATYLVDHIRAYWQLMQPLHGNRPQAGEGPENNEHGRDDQRVERQPPPESHRNSEEGLTEDRRGVAGTSNAEYAHEEPSSSRIHQPPAQVEEGLTEEQSAQAKQLLRQIRPYLQGDEDEPLLPGSSGSRHFPEPHAGGFTPVPHSSQQAGDQSDNGSHRAQNNEQPPEPPPQPVRVQQQEAAANPRNDRPQEDREFAFIELIGLHGPFNLLWENAITVLLTIWAFMGLAIWSPFMVGRAARQGLYDFVAYLASSEARLEALQTGSEASDLKGKVAGVLDWAMKLLGRKSSLQEGRLNAHIEARMATLSPLNRLAARLETALTGLELGDWFCLSLGYVVIISSAGVAFATLIAWKLIRNTNLRRELHSQRNIVRAAFADISHQTVQHCKYAALMAKVGIILALELTLLPALHGCWVDVCLLPLTASTVADRLLWFQISPVSFLLAHWTLGMTVLMMSATFMSIFCQQLRPGALPFLRDPFAREAEPIQELILLGLGQQLERQLLAMSALACLAVILIHLPLRLTKAIMPQLLPVYFSLTTPLGDNNLLFFNYLLPLMVSRLNVRLLVTRGLKFWLRWACTALELDDYMLPNPAGGNNRPLPNLVHGMPDSGDPAAMEAWRREMDGARARSGRLTALLALLLLTLLCFNTAVVIIPLTLGRTLLTAVGLSAKHDVYSASAGVYALWGAFLGAKQIQRLTATGQTRMAGRAIFHCLKTAVHFSALAVLSLGLLPLLIGLFVELVIMPLRLTEAQTPVFFVYHDWTIGLLAVKLGYQVLAGAWADPGGRQPAAGEAEDTLWQHLVRRLSANVRRMKAIGIMRIPFMEAFQTVLLPVLTFWGMAVCIPYVVSRGILPRIPYIPVSFMHNAFTYGWFFEANFVVGFLLFSELGVMFRKYQAKIRDQHYLLHRELINMPSNGSE